MNSFVNISLNNTCFLGKCSDLNYQKLFDEINTSLYKLALLEYNNTRFFLNKKKNCKNPVSNFNDLKYYNNILKRKLNNDCCLEDYTVYQIVSKIKSLMR